MSLTAAAWPQFLTQNCCPHPSFTCAE